MSASLPNELHKFWDHSRRLRQILDETKRCFEDINLSGQFNGSQLVTAELLKEEEKEVLSVIEKPQTIVLLGQTPYTKSRLVNELFNKTIFPPLDDRDNDSKFRMVRFKQGETLSVSLSLPDDYDLVDNLEAYNGPWNTIPKNDLELLETTDPDIALGTAVLEVTINHPLLRYGTQLIVSPSKYGDSVEGVLKKCLENVTPILVYGFVSDHLYDKDISELSILGKVTNFRPVFFVRVPPPGSRTVDTDPPDGAPGTPTNQIKLSSSCDFPKGASSTWSGKKELLTQGFKNSTFVSSNLAYQQLCKLGYLSDESSGKPEVRKVLTRDYFEVESEYVERFQEIHQKFALFSRRTLQSFLINASTVLNNSHTRCLNMFIMSAFDMARDMLITPKKLEFAKEKEEELYKSLMKISVCSLDNTKVLISQTISDMKDDLVQQAGDYDFLGVDMDEEGQIQTNKSLKVCTMQIQELVLSRLNHAVAGKLISSIDILRDSYTGTLTRCLESLESMDKDNPEGAKTTDALKQILNAAYQVEITVRSSSSLIKVLLERMKQMVQSMPWKTPPKIDTEWKRRVASDMLSSLSEARLAKSIASQIKDRLTKSHDTFLLALRQLESKHSGRLDKIEEQRLKLRKVHAPKVAKLALESTSLKDAVLYGMPQMGREVGRGQYGVVYACESWAGHSPCAIKSVVPPDDKHWNDLALEFFYTKNIPEHERIVALHGSVIDYQYGGGMSPAVLLVMDRLQRDLYTAIKQGLDWISRLQIAIDVVEGIRFLHSQGLVHRDIKLKNVLLDRDNRGKITDLGFCKPEAMMSGSIVGTPIHMAPELFTGRYDNSVDVYAFGILFWYICAGHVRLPSAFEQCANKDHLWQSVKKGLRPEKLATFDEQCANLMQTCWEKDSSKRPHLGDVESQLLSIFERFYKKRSPVHSKSERSHKSSRNIARHTRDSKS